jgi:tRNA(Ile)-lysidine synthase
VSGPPTPNRPTNADPVVADLLARAVFPPAGTEVTCAVSGGADSCALLALAVAADLRVTAVHVDHGLRAGSYREADLVASLASAWGAAFRAQAVQVPDGGDLEARARAARRAVLPPDALLGHTADDQAETVLLRLLRGTGPAGLAAMRPAMHPLLGLRRAETVALCAHLGVEPFEDPTNTDPRFTRNRVRHEVVPLLDDVGGRDVVPLLCRLAELAAEGAQADEDRAASIDPTDAAALRAAPQPVAVAALRRWWRERTGLEHPPDRAATERALEVVHGTSRACDVSAGWRLARTAGRLRLEAPDPHPSPVVDPGDGQGIVGPR